MKLLHDFFRLRLGGGLSRRRREATRPARVVTVPAPLAAHRATTETPTLHRAVLGEYPLAEAGGGQSAGAG